MGPRLEDIQSGTVGNASWHERKAGVVEEAEKGILTLGLLTLPFSVFIQPGVPGCCPP